MSLFRVIGLAMHAYFMGFVAAVSAITISPCKKWAHNFLEEAKPASFTLQPGFYSI